MHFLFCHFISISRVSLTGYCMSKFQVPLVPRFSSQKCNSKNIWLSEGVKRVEISQGQESRPNFDCGGVSFWRRLCLDRGHWDRCHGGIRRRMTDGGETDKWADKSQLVRKMFRDGLVATVEENNRTQMGNNFQTRPISWPWWPSTWASVYSKDQIDDILKNLP